MIPKSHLLQMRGLKLHLDNLFRCRIWSHLLQMRGLKQSSVVIPVQSILSHLLQMRGLKLLNSLGKMGEKGRIFYRCVD